MSPGSTAAFAPPDPIKSLDLLAQPQHWTTHNAPPFPRLPRALRSPNGRSLPFDGNKIPSAPYWSNHSWLRRL